MDISVIIVNYNVRYFIEQCILSIIDASKNLNTEIIVVDNNSSDNSCQFIQKNYPQIKLISNKIKGNYQTISNFHHNKKHTL